MLLLAIVLIFLSTQIEIFCEAVPKTAEVRSLHRSVLGLDS